MKDGLGQKYGAPRRNAQERIRSEVARSEVAAAKIDELLELLGLLCKRALDAELGAAEAAREKARLGRKAPKQPLSVRIRRCLMELRICCYRRAVYLRFLGDLRAPALDGCLDVAVPADLETEPVAKDRGDPADEVLSTATFWEVVELVELKCRADTKDLYAKEGKEDQLGPEGAPEALLRFLEEQRERASVQLEGAKRKLREQVGLLQELLNQASAAAMEDMVSRAQARVAQARGEVEREASVELEALEQTKQEHKIALKPQLSDPNAKAELDRLCAEEQARTQKAQQVISKTEQKLLLIEEEKAADFDARFVKVVYSMGVLLDTTLRTSDLGWLPGDDEIVPKRKCLKRLKMQKRKKALHAQAGAVGATEVEGGETTGAADDEGNTTAVPPRFPRRAWPALAKFGGMTLEAARLEQEVPGTAEDGAEAEAEADADESVGATPAADADSDGRLTTFVTTAHRHFIRARDGRYSAYQRYFFSTVAKLRQHYSHNLEAEQAWARNWATMVSFLQKDEEGGDGPEEEG